MPGLPVVDAPPVDRIRKGFFEVEGLGPAYSHLDEGAFVDEQFEVVPSSLRENLSANRGLKAAALLGCANQAILIESQLCTCFQRIPCEKG